MKHVVKRSFSLLLALAMIVSLFAGVTISANAAQPTSASEVVYVTSGNYIYNWGKRDTPATFLTTYAQNYYTGSYSYATLSALSGSSTATADAIYSSALGSAIHDMLVAKQTSQTSYDGTKTLYQYTDCEESKTTTGAISSYYSGTGIGPDWGSTPTWNREHTWPNSKGLGSSDENDIMMLRPTAQSENSNRGNTAYGSGSSYWDPNQFNQSLHGDIARLMLQHLMRWGNTSKFYGSGGVIESRAVLLQWMQEDPVDTWEMGRNDAVQAITGVRNVFVDYPELAFKLLGESVPANYTTPSGGAISYTVTATSNNTSYGTVSVSGTVITASPKSGYYASGYTVTSGTATVSQNGNTFIVTPSTNCTVRINFAAATTLTVTFSVPAGVTQSAMTCNSGASITLPTPSGTPSDSSHDYTFRGWVTTTYDNVTTLPTLLAAGSSYTPAGSTTLYALYQYTVGGSGSSSSYTRITSASDITDGASYVFTSTATGKAMSHTVENNWVKPGGTYTGDTVSPAATDVWTVSGNVISCDGGKLYSSAAKSITLNSSNGTAWTFAASGSGFQIKTGSNIMSYNSTGWRPYNGGYGSDTVFYIYKAGSGGTDYYTTLTTACSHTYTTIVTAPTCTTAGYTTYTCSKCGDTYTGNQTAALGHNYGAYSSNNNGTHSRTCSRCAAVDTADCSYTSATSGTTTTFTCSVCSYSYQTQLGTYTITYYDHGTTTTGSCVEGGSVNLPATASTIDGYTFVGWVESAISDETIVAPTILTGSYTPSGSVTLYACYTRTEESTGGGNYEKVTSDSGLTDGLYLIVNESAGRAMDASKESTIGSGTNYIAVTVSNDTIASSETVDASAFTYSASAGTFATPGGLYICRTSGTSGGAVTTSSTASSAANTISISNGSATVACGSYYLRYNTGGYFRYYTSASQQAIQLYKKSGGSATNTYYTTNPDTSVPCEHENTTLTGYVAATCTTAGYTGDYVCDDCGATVTTGTAIPATGHIAGSSYGHNDNQHWLLCSVCGEAVTATAASHTWSEYVVTTPATEGAAGEKTSTCSVCGATRTQAIPALGYDYTVSFSVPTGVTAVAAMSCNSNGSITLPSAGAPADYAFVGWVETALAEDSATAPATVYAANGSYTASGNVTLFALYSYATSGGTGTPGSFTLVTSGREDWSGEYVLTNYGAAKVLKTDAVASPGAADSAVSLANTGITLSGDTMTGVSSAYILVAEKISGSDTNYSLRLKGSADAKYLNTANSNGLSAVTSTSGSGAQWTISVASNGKATIKSVAYTGRTIRYNTSSYVFRTYTSGQGDVYLYGGTTAGTMYTTSPASACVHPNPAHTAASAATCTSAGNSEYWYCADCGKYFSDSACETQITLSDTVIPATGHSYSSAVTTAATCTTDGVTTYTCASCGDTYTETIAALGHNWDAGVQTTAPTATTTGVMTYTCTRCGATRTESIPALGVTQHYARATSVTSGSDYVMVFHYTYNGADTWFMVGNIGGSTSAITEIDAPVNDVISLEPGEANLWNIATNDDGYALKLGSKYLSGTSSSTTLSNSNTPVTWTLAAGSATDTFRFKIGTRAIGLQSGTSVRNYALSNDGNSGTNYIFDIYLFANACQHTNTQLQGAYEATCTTNGYTGDLVCLDCGAVVTPGTTILQGHDYVEVSTTQPTCTTAGNIHYECSRCDSTKDVAIEALGHNYQQSAHLDATCTADGYTTYTCANCGDSYTDTIPATGHNYDAETGICANCGDQLASYTVSFTVPAGINAIADITAFAGATVTLPTPTGTLLANAENYVFAGWVTAEVDDSTNVSYLEPGSYTVTGNVTFKALYTWIDEANSFGTEGVYKLLTENDLNDLATGWKLIIANDGVWQSKTMAMAGYANSGHDKFVGANVTVSNNTITLSSNTTVQQFTVVKDSATGSFYLISDLTDNEGNDYYLTSCTNTASANDITLTSNPTAAALWEITYHADETVKLTAQGSYTANTVLFNSSNYNGFFSCYGETYYTSETKPSNIYGIRLFASNPIYHFTTAPAQNCEHLNVIWTDNGDGTCSCICADCDHIVVDHQTHAWTLNPNAAGTVAATCTAGGKAGYVCGNCSAVKLENTEALGHDYVGVQTTAPTCSAEGVMTYTCSRCGESYTEAIPAIEHIFVDGECTMCGAALYVLVTEAPENWEGEYLIVYVANDNAKVFDGKHDAEQNYTVGTFYGAEGSESSLICVPNPDDYVMNFVPTDGGYNIMNADADWWSYTAASNGFSVNTNTSFAGTYTIALDASGNAVITNAGGRTLKFNNAAAASGGDRFRFYGTSIYTTIKLYEKYGTCHHNWVLDANNSTAATCTAAGNNVYECSLCGESKNETVAALGHDYLYETVAPTCTAEGYTICTCSRCDYEDIPEYSVTAAIGHDFSVLVEDAQHYIAPTCTGEGLAYYQCSRCDAFSEEGTILEPTGHNFVNGVCTICGATLTAQTYTLMTSLNFANAGSVLLVFEYDGAFYAVTEEVSSRCLVAQPVTITNNTITIYDDGTYAILIPQTSLNDGTNTGTGFNTVNNDYLHVNSNALAFAAETANAALAITPAQVWSGQYDAQDNLIMNNVANAYFLQGKTTGNYVSNLVNYYEDSKLTVNNDSFYAVPIYFYASSYVPEIAPEPSEHNTIYVPGSAATCTEAGYLGYYMCIDQECECAGKMYADIYCTEELLDLTIPALGHSYAWDGTVGDGEHILECTRCGDCIFETCDTAGANGCCSVCGYGATDDLGILSAALVLNGKIDIAYTARIPDGYTNPRMVFVGPNGAMTVTAYTSSGENYVFTYTGINPQCMGDNISATLYATKNGAEESDTQTTYSVRQYCVNKLADSTISADLRTLLSDMLAYGAAAQTYMGYHTNALVNSGSDIINPTCSTFVNLSGNAASFDGEADENIFWISAGLTLTDSVAMTFRFRADDVSDLIVYLTINGRTQEYTEFTAAGEGVYEVSFTGISAEEFGDTVIAAIERDEEQIGSELSYSVNAYVQSKQADGNAALAALVKALYNYGASAEAFAG